MGRHPKSLSPEPGHRCPHLEEKDPGYIPGPGQCRHRGYWFIPAAIAIVI